MNKYQNGKIYKITSKQTDDVYIGSTIQDLHERFSRHKLQNKGSSVKLFKYDDAIIELIELYPCKTRHELLWRERYYYDTINCVNSNHPITSKEEKYLYMKDWNEKNKDRIDELRKIRYVYDKEKRHNDYMKNKDKLIIKQKEWRQKNKERNAFTKKRRMTFQQSHFGKLCKMF